MRLKYYLRGVGIGIIVTTIIFMITIALNKNETTPQNTSGDNDKSTTVSEAEKDTQKEDAAGTETEETETGETDSSKKDKADADSSKKEQKDSEKPNAGQLDPEDSGKKDPAADKATDTKTESKEKESSPSGQKPSDTDKETKPNAGREEKVRFEIKGGEYSDTVCKKLKEAGLIDDAKSFNSYLIQKDYDNLILPGVYEIPKDSTFEEIAALLTTKVE